MALSDWLAEFAPELAEQARTHERTIERATAALIRIEDRAGRRARRSKAAKAGWTTRRVSSAVALGRRRGMAKAVEALTAKGIGPDEWATDFWIEWGDQYDLDLHDMYEIGFGYADAPF